jgi:phosphoribosylglycinamide formyltransferase-1
VPAFPVVWDRTDESRADFDARLTIEVEATDPDLVLLLGWMHVLPASFVERYDCLNVHPAYLPLDPAADEVTYPDGSAGKVFRGAHAVDDALAAGSSWVGASVHKATAETDRGEVYARAPLPVLPGEARDALELRIHHLERRVVNTAIRRWTWEQRE